MIPARAAILTPSILAPTILALALLALAGPGQAACPPAGVAAPRPLTQAIPDSAAFSAAVVMEVNRHRCAAGLAPVGLDDRATRSSRAHSLWMATAGRLTHNSTQKGRENLGRRLQAEGIPLRRAGYESIGELGFYSVQGLGCHSGRDIPTEAVLARRIVAMWVESPAHRAQVLSPRVSQAGAAAAVSVNPRSCGRIYLTLTLFG